MKRLWFLCMNFVDAFYTMHYEKHHEMMLWIDHEISDLKYASCMKEYGIMFEKVFFIKLVIWKCMNYLNFVSYEECIYLGLNDTGRARRDSYEALYSHAGGKNEMFPRASDRLGVDSWIMPPDFRRLACFWDSGNVSWKCLRPVTILSLAASGHHFE